MAISGFMGKRRLFALFATLAACARLWAQAPQALIPTYFVDVRPGDKEALTILASEHFDIAGVDRKQEVIGVVATAEELDRLVSLGFKYVIREVSHPLDGFAPQALSDYTDPAEMSAFLDTVQTNYPGIAKKVVVKSGLYDGHTIYAMKITKDVNSPNDRPSFVLDAQHHAREVMTAEISSSTSSPSSTRTARPMFSPRTATGAATATPVAPWI
jgi:hypothetical protein